MWKIKFTPTTTTARLHTKSLSKIAAQQPGLYYKLAEGKTINQLSNGLYSIDDKSYYIKPSPGMAPTIRDGNGKKELIVPVENSIKYSIIW